MAKAKITKEMLDENFEWFKEIVKNYHVKTINLNLTKEEILDEVMTKIFAGDFDNLKSASKIVIKSYVEQKPEEIKPFVSLEDIEIRKPLLVLQDFFSKYIKEGEYTFKTFAEVNEELAKVYSDKMEDVFGDVVFVNYPNLNLAETYSFKRKFLAKMQEKGYKEFSQDSCFLIKNKIEQPQIKQENQSMLLRAYNDVMQIYVENYRDFQRKDKESFEKFWELIELFLDNVEVRLSEESKKNPKFVENKQKADKFFEANLHEVKSKIAKFGKHYQDLEKARIASKKIAQGQASEQDLKSVDDIYQTILQVGKVLSIKDEKGINYPANYFTATKFEPSALLNIINFIEKDANLSQEQIDKLAPIKTMIRQAFPNFSQTNIGNNFEIVQLLDLRFKGVKKTNENVLYDFSDDKQYKNFVEKVENVVKENNLPKTEQCIYYVARDLANGRYPINLKENEKHKIK